MQQQASQSHYQNLPNHNSSQNPNPNAPGVGDATSAAGFCDGPNAQSLVKMQQQAPETPAVQTHYQNLPHHLYTNNHSSPNPNPNPLGVDSTANAGAAYNAQASMYAQAVNAGATSAAGCFEGSYAQNWLNSYGADIVTNGSEQLVAALANSIAYRSTFFEKVRRHHEWCEVCNIHCTSKELLDSHKQGKKHKRKLEILKASIVPAPVTPVVPENPIIGPPEIPSKKNKESSEPEDVVSKIKKIVDSGTTVDNVKTCEICNVVCNSESVFQNHLVGKIHRKNLEKTGASVTHVPVAPLVPDNSSIEQDVEQKKISIVENVAVVDIVKTCELCNVLCNSDIVFQNHLAGKVHKKNLVKTGTSVTQSPVGLVVPNNMIIGPQTKAKKKRKANETEDLESKKRKIVEAGTSVNAVKTCEICNVVCNDDLVFKYHLAGKKHLSMMRKGKVEVPVAIAT